MSCRVLFSAQFVFATLLVSLSLIGCKQTDSAGETPSPAKSAPLPGASPAAESSPATEVATSNAKPVSDRPANEAGVIPVLEYHRITVKPSRYDRSAADFRKDLERLYKEGYRPVALQDAVAGKFDLPRGASPVILTFDDADATQFRYKPDGTLDPNCAVAILKAFQESHPDWKSRATFYVLPESAFGPAKERPEKFRFLREELGCEIGNHTVKHVSLRSLSDAKVQEEIGGAVQKIQKILPDTPVISIALPMGIAPKNRGLLASGTFAGKPYTNATVMLVGANPAPSPYLKSFDPLRIPRIQAVEGPSGITYWLDRMKKEKSAFVSDGAVSIVTVPVSQISGVSPARLHGNKLTSIQPGDTP